jgi:hypothetical protein
MALLKELFVLVAGRGGGDDGEEGCTKMNLVIEGADNKVNIVVVVHKEIFISINKYL